MDDREDEIKRERGIEQFVGQRFCSPEGEQSKNGEAGDGLRRRNFFVKPGDGDGDQVNQENETEHQPRPLRERREIQKPQR